MLHPHVAHPEEAHEGEPVPRRGLALVVVCTVALVAATDITITNVALPAIARDLDADTSDLQWVVDVYNVVLAGMLLLGGGLADRYGRRHVFLLGLVVFAVCTWLAAFAPTVDALIAARAGMGLGAVLFTTPAMAIIASMYAPDERSRAIAMWAVFGAVGLALGPIVGALLLDTFWWGAVFLVTLPVAAGAVFVGFVSVPDSRRPGTPPLDALGGLLSVVGLGLLVFGVIEGPEAGWISARGFGATVLGAVLLAAFVVWELHVDAPMFDLRVLRIPEVTGGALVLFAAYVAFTGALFVVPQFLEFVRGASTLASGLSLVPFAMVFGVVSSWSPRVLQRAGPRSTIFGGLVGTAVGVGLVAVLPSRAGMLDSIVGMAVAGAGLGLLIAPASGVVVNALPAEKAGEGSSLNIVSRFIGAAVGIAVIGTVLASIYTRRLADELSRLPAAERAEARSGIGGALDVVARLTGSAAEALEAAAQDAFVAGARWGLLVATAVTLVTAAVWLVVSRRSADAR